MVNVASILAITLAASPSACEVRCAVNNAQSNSQTCVYSCGSDSARSSQENAAEFSGALRQNGHSCSSNAGQVRCSKTSAFGGCGDHVWKTGRGC